MNPAYDMSRNASRLLADVYPHTPARPFLLLAGGLLIAAVLQSPAAHARAFLDETADGVAVRCSSLNSTSLPEASLDRYGVDGDAATGVISCVLQPADDPEAPHLSAKVSIEYHAIGQTPQPIEVREVLDNDLATYLGTYPVEGEDPLTFTITIEAEETGRLELSFTDPEPRA